MGERLGRRIAKLVWLAMLLLAGCGGKEAPTATMAASQSDAVAAVTTPIPGGYAFRLVSDLSMLNSYRARYTLLWEGVEAGKEDSGSWDVVDERVQQPPGRHLLSINTRQNQAGRLELIQTGSQSYLDTGSGWVALTTAEFDLLAGEPFLDDPMVAISANRGHLSGTAVTVNGTVADHYVFAEDGLGADFGLGVMSAARGDVWVANALGVVVKYRVRYEGTQLTIGGSGEGVLQIAFDLLDVNTPIEIEPPATSALALPQDVPLVPGAYEVTAVRGFLHYKVALAGAEVAAFYEEEMPVQGWSRREGGVPGLILFDKDGRSVQIMIQDGGEVTSVVVMIGED